jgi:hypothetical protein
MKNKVMSFRVTTPSFRVTTRRITNNQLRMKIRFPQISQNYAEEYNVETKIRNS